MSYTNGFLKTQVLSALVGRLGWSDTTLNATNQSSRSGRYFDDGSFHSLVTVPNIKATAPKQTDWDAYFTKRQEAAVLKCLNGVFTSAEYFEQHTSLYQRVNQYTEAIPNRGNFCGWELKVAPASDIAVQIHSAALLFDGSHTFNLYLFRSGNTAPLKTIAVTTVANEETVVPLDGVYLKYPGTYWLGYFQSDLGIVQAIQEQAGYTPTYNFGARPFIAPETEADFVRTTYSYPQRPYGVNLSVSSFKDYTQAIQNQPHLFDEVIGMQMEYMVLEQMLTSLNSNGTERLIKEGLDQVGLNLYLYGSAPITDGPKTEGLQAKLLKKFQEVRKQFYKPSKAQTVTLC